MHPGLLGCRMCLACSLAPAAGRLAATRLDEALRLQELPGRIVDVREPRWAQQHAAEPEMRMLSSTDCSSKK